MQWSIERLKTCQSTMDEARERARAGASDGTVVVADQMTAGRGQAGSTWYAPTGGLYLSMVQRDLQDPHLLTLALGNAVADAMEVAGAEPRLKWVNDVWIGERKVAGILVEGESTGDRFDFLVAGIGINANGTTTEWPDEVRDVATTLEEAIGAENCIPDLESFLLDSVARWVQKVRDDREQDILDAFRGRDLLKGRKVRVGDVAGVAEGVDDRGRLVVAGTPLHGGRVHLLD